MASHTQVQGVALLTRGAGGCTFVDVAARALAFARINAHLYSCGGTLADVRFQQCDAARG